MKYSFMTFSCPELSLDELFAAAGKFGYDGIELRTSSKHNHGVETTISSRERAEIRKMAEKSGFEISCLATSCKFSNPANAEENINSALDHIKLASDIGVKRIRVFGGQIPENIERKTAEESIVKSLKKLSSAAEKAAVYVCIETHDSWCEPSSIAEMIEKTSSPLIVANWDIMHPVRVKGKSIKEAFDVLRPWIKHVHVHDGAEGANGSLRSIGEGIVDHKTAIQLLKNMNYDGFISGEWINWEPFEVHLPREIAKLRNFEEQ